MNMTNIDSTKGYKVRLYPNKKQRKLLFEYFNMAKEVYNKTIDLQEEQYMNYIINDEERYKRLSFYSLNNIFTELKKTDEYSWLNNYNSDSIRGSIRDCCTAYSRYDDKSLNNKKPKYKTNESKKQFYTRPDRMSITDNYIKLSSIGEIKYCNSYSNEILGHGNIKSPNHLKYYNSRVSFDGNNFYLSFTIERDDKHQLHSYEHFQGNEEWQKQKIIESIGIDVGLKNDKWLVDSTGKVVERPNSDKLNKRIARLQRKYQRQKDTNLKKNKDFFKYHPNGSKNMQKTLAMINRDFKKISNRRRNVVHEYACDLISLKPKSIVMESSISMNLSKEYNKNYIKNKLNHMVYDAALYETTMIIEEKAINNGIKVIRANKEFPSSQICSCCGYRQNIGQNKLYKCPECGSIINRDLNAAINLANYEHIKDKYIQKDNKKIKIDIKTLVK